MVTILIVDDKQASIDSYRNLIKEYDPDIEILEAKSAEDALALLLTVEPSMVMTDYEMGSGMNGQAFVEKMFEDELVGAAPIIVVSAHPDLNDDKVCGWGAIGFLQKPFSSEDMVDLLDRYLTTGNSNAGVR